MMDRKNVYIFKLICSMQNRTSVFLHKLPSPNCESYVFISVGLSVCLWTILEKHARKDFHKIYRMGRAEHNKVDNLKNWGLGVGLGVWGWGVVVTFTPLNAGVLFLCFQGNLFLLATLRGNGWTDFQLSVPMRHAGHTVEDYRCVAVDSLNPCLMFLFPGPRLGML